MFSLKRVTHEFKETIQYIWSAKKSVISFKKNINFSIRDHVLIPSNIRGHSKLSLANVEQPTMFRNKKAANIGEYRIEIGRIRCGLGFYCYPYST